MLIHDGIYFLFEKQLNVQSKTLIQYLLKKGLKRKLYIQLLTNIWWLDQRNWKLDLLSLDPSIPGQNDQQSNHYKIWGRDHSFEEIMHPHGHNTWEFQMKTNVFVKLQHYICEQTAALYKNNCQNWGAY